MTLEQAIIEHILKTMNEVDQNQTRAAQILGITPKTIRNWLRKIGIKAKRRGGRQELKEPTASDRDSWYNKDYY
jgi:DNA-binding NtrC family response regulator